VSRRVYWKNLPTMLLILFSISLDTTSKDTWPYTYYRMRHFTDIKCSMWVLPIQAMQWNITTGARRYGDSNQEDNDWRESDEGIILVSIKPPVCLFLIIWMVTIRLGGRFLEVWRDASFMRVQYKTINYKATTKLCWSQMKSILLIDRRIKFPNSTARG